MQSNEVTRLNVRQLSNRLGVSKQTVWRWYRYGDFPKPHFLGQNRLWLVSEVERWERTHVADRSTSVEGNR